jgi:Zn-dependent alcohol dehydrogenase
MIGLLDSRRLPLEPLFTAHLPLSQFKMGFERLHTGQAAKILLDPHA